MNVPHTNKQKGFTIIEVVLVLAIAALIFLMVFIALPQLQKSQRDTQRRDDLGRVSTQITNYQSSNRGRLPDSAQFIQAGSGFVTKYLDGSGSIAGESFSDPSKGPYNFVAGPDVLPDDSDTVNKIAYNPGRLCGDDGAVVSTGAGNRNFALRMKLENQTSFYCLDNK